jgi:ribosomal protein S3AE
MAELNNRVIKLDVTRKLKGKGVDLVLKIIVENGKAIAVPKKLTLLPFFIKHMMHKGTSYVEDSIVTETKDSIVAIKPFLITRKKVSRAVSRTLRNSARNWIIDYLKTKTSAEVFDEILSNQLQRPLSLKLKKTYPLAICEIRIFEIKKPLEKKAGEKTEAVEVGQAEVKKEEKEFEEKTKAGEVNTKEIKIEEKIEITEPEPKAEEKESEKAEAEKAGKKPSKKKRAKKEDKK